MSAKQHTFTLGIEEEFAIIDPETRELRSHIQEILEYGKVILKEQIKPEMHQSVVELGTEICQSIVDARAHVIELRSRLAELAGGSGLKIASAGTHPFSHWRDQLITQGERYREIVKDMQQLARANLIFGLHVHVGIPDRDVAIHVMNQARYFLPHIYALSVNSPFWVGQDTGLKGYRLKVFERFQIGTRCRHPRDESGALFFAAHLRAFGQLAVLGRPGHGLERLSTKSVRAFSDRNAMSPST